MNLYERNFDPHYCPYPGGNKMPESDSDSHGLAHRTRRGDGVRNPAKTVVFREPAFTGMPVAKTCPELH